MREDYEHRNAAKRLGSLPLEVLKKYEIWKDIACISGPEGLKRIAGFNDEALRGDWKGHRSSRLNIQYHVIYRIVRDQVLVQVIDVTAHDYTKK